MIEYARDKRKMLGSFPPTDQQGRNRDEALPPASPESLPPAMLQDQGAQRLAPVGGRLQRVSKNEPRKSVTP